MHRSPFIAFAGGTIVIAVMVLAASPTWPTLPNPPAHAARPRPQRSSSSSSDQSKGRSLMTPDSSVGWPVVLPLVLFFSGIGAAAAITQLLAAF